MNEKHASLSQKNHVFEMMSNVLTHPLSSATRKLQASSHEVGLKLSPVIPTGSTLNEKGSNDLVVGEDHLLGLSCQL